MLFMIQILIIVKTIIIIIIPLLLLLLLNMVCIKCQLENVAIIAIVIDLPKSALGILFQ